MNLKQAAARLGVHYQTAYRWVRSGDLAAVRVGARYEVSDAAIHRFLATRQSVLRQAEPLHDAPAPATDDPEELLLDLEAMAGEPLLSIPAITQYAARRGREVLGDLCLVAIANPDGSIDRAAIDHLHADRAAFVASALSVTGPEPPRVGAVLAPVMQRGDVVRIPHVPQDRLRAGFRPELRQYLDDHPVVGVVAAPIRMRGAVRGMVVFTRDTPARPYTEEDERFVVAFAERVGTLALSAEEIARAWVIRDRLAWRFRAWLAAQPLDAEFDAATVAELLAADEDPTAAVAVYDADGRIIGANAAVEKIAGYGSGALAGRSFVEVVDPSDVETERENFARLASGELDYHDFHANRRRSDGSMVDFAMHRVAVRRLDSTLACIISVGRPVRVSSRIKDLIGAG